MTRALVSALLLGSLVACNRAPLDTAPNVDLQQFQGKWYEVAHLPRPTQKDCIGTTATYTMQGNGQLAFVHECTLTDGTYHGATALAKVSDARDPAKMQVDFGGVMGDYWILEVAPDYRYAVVGHPSRDYLWILSRKPTMDPNDLKTVVDHSQAKDFDTSKLEYTKQGADPVGTPAPASDYGCATGGVGSGAFFGLAMLGMIVARRRRRL
jgi:apolipoprotein D and lipocalin family protein